LASDVLIAERIWLNTQSVLAVKLNQPVLANMWWTLRLKKPRIANSKALVLWLNSTLGLIAALGTRQETRGAWIAFKKPTITSLPVLDLNRIDSSAIKKLAQVYDSVANEVVQPFHEMAADPVRSRIDNAISETLNLPDISSLRVMLAREPFCSLKPL